MGLCSFVVSLITLDNLYSLEKAKGRANWLIFCTCKVMAPVLLVMMTEHDDISTYRNVMLAHYEVRGTQV